MSNTTTLPPAVTEAITAQRTAWKTVRRAQSKLESHNGEAEKELCGCQAGNDPKLSLAAAAAKNSEKTALRIEISALAETRRKDLEKAIEDYAEEARNLVRVQTAAPLNSAVQAVRASRVERRMVAIQQAVAKWSPDGNVEAILSPALRVVQERHRQRNGGSAISESGIVWRGTVETRFNPAAHPASDAQDFLRAVAEDDPSVREIDALPALGGPNDVISEEEFEAVAKFLENLSPEETTAI